MEKQKWWGQDNSGLTDLQEEMEMEKPTVKDERVTVQGPAKKPHKDNVSHGGAGWGCWCRLCGRMEQ